MPFPSGFHQVAITRSTCKIIFKLHVLSFASIKSQITKINKGNRSREYPLQSSQEAKYLQQTILAQAQGHYFSSILFAVNHMWQTNKRKMTTLRNN